MQRLVIRIRTSLWFVPTLMVLGAIGAAVGLIELDRHVHWKALEEWPTLFGASAQGSRGMLTAIATSMITVAGVTFSITVAALAQASNQYSPLVLRNFMQDRANQIVLGAFGGIFVYSLVVLRSIRGGDEEFVPSIATFMALLSAIAGIGFLLFFIHHIASLLQASSILNSIASTTLRAIETTFPHDLDEKPQAHDTQEKEFPSSPSQPLFPKQIGYIQTIRYDAIAELARKHDIFVRIEKKIGDFALQPVAMASIVSADPPDEQTIDAVRGCFAIGEYRIIEHDPAFGIRQIVDMAVKALSPAVNDPTTACSCLQYLSAILLCLVPKSLATLESTNKELQRVATADLAFEYLADLAFGQIRQAAKADVTVFSTLIITMGLIAERATTSQRRGVMLTQLALTVARAEQVFELDADQKRVVDQANEIMWRIG